MTTATDILRMIESAHGPDMQPIEIERRLDEIDVRVDLFINNREIVSYSLPSSSGSSGSSGTWWAFKKYPQYTRSLDAQASMGPDGWWFIVKADTMRNNFCVDMWKPAFYDGSPMDGFGGDVICRATSVSSGWLNATEAIARLNARIQALEWEKGATQREKDKGDERDIR